jgi:RNA-directed DNA polymerase
MGGRGEMIKAPIRLQDLRRRIYAKAKAEESWRFWGLFVHVCKMETLREAYGMAKDNNGAPGLDGVTFEAIESAGVESFLEQIRDELVTGTYQPPGTGGRRSRRTTAVASASCRFLPSGTGWCRELSS